MSVLYGALKINSNFYIVNASISKNIYYHMSVEHVVMRIKSTDMYLIIY